MVMARAIMVLGTGSHVGKSLMTAALCRLLARQGCRVAPFKSQNMSLNSAATFEGLEIGRAQALQAEAAGIAPSVDMNPILLKPSGHMCSQVVVHGKVWGNISAGDYHRRRVEELLPYVEESYARLASAYDVIVLEGAGSPAEINLKQHDIANMRMAAMADAACLLVGDIDRGGVFASLFGTMELLAPAERQRIRGFLINKFRGDLSLLAPGISAMEERLQICCTGVVPYIDGLSLEEEDSVGLPSSRTEKWPDSSSLDRQLRVAILVLPSFSNFTDFDALKSEPSVCVRFCRDAQSVLEADLVVLPGSKQTVDDLLWLRSSGLDRAVLASSRAGLMVGICGGMQMLGETIVDPAGVERQGVVPGLGLLPIQTIMQTQKVTSRASGHVMAGTLFAQSHEGLAISGYEIHMGETVYTQGAVAFASVARYAGGQKSEHLDGCVGSDGRIFGTYLHGLFDDDNFRRTFLAACRDFHHLLPARHFENWQQKRESSFDRLAAEVERSLDLSQVFSWAGVHYQARATALQT